MARARSVTNGGKPAIRAVGLFGGMFNPPHIGHLAAAQEAQARLNLDIVQFIPTGDPPHRKNPETPAEIRLKMTRLACEKNNKFSVSEFEMKNSDKSYTINTVTYFCEKLPEATIYLLVGTDQLNLFHTWQRWQEIIKKVKLVVLKRSNSVVEDLPAGVVDNFQMLEIPGLNISSSQIRSRVKQGLPLRYLVPDKICKFIEREKLYNANR